MEKWRAYLNVKGSDEKVIVKAAVIMMQCPVPHCPEPGGKHQRLPRACFDWWRKDESKILALKGVNDNTTEKAINEKISHLRRNHNHRGKSVTTNQTKSGTGHECANARAEHQPGTSNQEQPQPRTCEWCQTVVPLASHLTNAESCLQHYRGTYLPYQGGIYTQNMHLSIFDLGLVRDFCINPSCSSEWKDLAQHLRGPCINHYQREGPLLYNGWKEHESPKEIYVKLNSRRKYVKTLLEADRGRLQNYKKEIDEMLRIVCSSCRLQGPFLDRTEHKMEFAGTIATEHGLSVVWHCGSCRSKESLDMQVQTAKLQEVGSPGQDDDDTLKPVRFEDISGGGSHIVFVPASLFPNQPRDDSFDFPQSTTILVPKEPEALHTISDEAFIRAAENKIMLKSLTNFFSKRPSQTSLEVTLSLLHKKKLLDIREERTKLMVSMSTSKGEIISRNHPKQANIKDRGSHYDATLNLCLNNTCSWSEGCKQQKMDESSARARINGQVKTRVSLALLKKLAFDNPTLEKVLESTFLVNGLLPTMSLAPIVLQQLVGKVELLRKHFIASIYNNWDLEVEFSRDEWTVELVGFLYSEQYENLNKLIARKRATSDDLLNTIIDHPDIFPTASLDPQRIADFYDMSIERAQVKQIQIKEHLYHFWKSGEGGGWVISDPIFCSSMFFVLWSE